MMSSIGGKSKDSANFYRTSRPGQSSNGNEFCESEELCKETEGLRILDEFKKLYENRIDAVDQDSSVPEFERISTKFNIMTEWVKDLREQNVMLVRTVEDLEQAAVSRVKLLEDKLLHSSNLVSENIIQCTNSGEALNNLSDRVGELERDEDYLQKKIENLQSDIRGLLELIRRAREENCWSYEDIKFCEITPADIPAPLDCACEQIGGGAQDLKYKHDLETCQDKEKKLLARMKELEEKLSDSNNKISQKDATIKKFRSQILNLRDILKERSSFADHIPFCNNVDYELEIMQMAEILESAFVAKNLEVETLQQRLQESNTKLGKLLHENEQFEENNKQIRELKFQLATLQKESLESREALASEVAEKHDQVMSLRNELQLLEEECRHLNMHAQYKEDVIKKLREERAQMKEKDSPCSRNILISTDPYSDGDSEEFCPHQDKILIYLTKTKQLMEKEKETFSSLKEEIEKITNELRYREKQDYRQEIPIIYQKLQDMESLLKNYRSEVIGDNKSVENMKKCLSDTEDNLVSLQIFLQNSLEVCFEEECQSDMEEIIKRLYRVTYRISQTCSEKEKIIALADLAAKGEPNICNKDTCNEPNHESVIATFLQQFKKMEEFRVCTVEAQAATEDLREEMETVISNFNCRHEKYCELTILVAEVQNYLISTKEKIADAINQLKLQEEERSRYKERISTGRDRLKGMKNEINQSRSKISQCVRSMQENNQEIGSFGFTEIYTSNDVLGMVVDEVEQVVSNLQAFHSREHSAVSLLSEMDSQLLTLENNLKKLFIKNEEVLQENEANQKIFEEQEKCMEKSEKELDYAHTRMQDVLENIFSAMDEINEFDIVKDNQTATQDVNKSLKVQEEYHKLRKEYEQLRMKMIEDSHKKEVDERIIECKCKITQLLDQVRVLQNEVRIGQEANLILKQNIISLENELNCASKKYEAHRRSYSTESMELNRKILDLEGTMKRQKEIESKLRRSLTSSELELKKSKDMLNSFHTSSEGTFSSCGAQLKFEGVPQSFKVLQQTIHQTRSDLLDLGNELKKLVCEGSSHSCSSTTSVMAAIDMLGKYGTNVESCFAEIEKLRSALYSKDKLLDDKEEIITIQKDTILITQSELKDVHAKLQEKINAQDAVIDHLEKDNKQLQNKIELQVQTIGHLQNAVVQTKRSLDQVGQKSVSENEKKNEAIRRLNIYLTETQHQYSECFAEAAKQDSLLEVQRDSIESLQQKIIYKEYNELFKIIILHCVYSANIYCLRDQLLIRTCDCEILKSQVNSLQSSNRLLEERYLSAKMLWEKTDFDLKCLEKQKNSCLTKSVECKISDQEMESLQQESNSLMEENANLQTELQKYRMDFEIIEQELKKKSQECLCITNLKSELERLGNEAKQLKSKLEKENEDLKLELKKCKVEFDIIEEELKQQSEKCIPNLKSELERVNSENEKLSSELEEGRKQIEEFMRKLQISEDKRIKLEERLLQELDVNQREKLDSSAIKEELYKRNREIKSLTAEANDKQEELQMLQELRTDFEKMEDLEKINELKDKKLMKCKETFGNLCDDILVQNDEIKNLREQANCYESLMADQTEIIEKLKEELLSTEQQRENCISELNSSKEMICILKSLLKEKSDCMVKLQADYQMLKNDNKIMKVENGLFESKAKEDICELKSKIKEIQIQLCIAEDNYKTVTQDFNKSQELLLKTVKREAEMQKTLTNVEKGFYSKMRDVEKEEAKLKDMINKMREELEEAKEELSSKKMELEQIQSACNLYSSQLENTHYDLQGLKENLLKLEETNCYLKQKIQNCREENCALLKQKKVLEQTNCKCINELEGMHKSLIGLRKECKMKTKSLASVTAELTQATASRSELCNESQYVVSCIRDWMEEQRSIVESLNLKLKTKQQQLIQLSFEKKALIAKVKEQRRIINAFMQKRKRSQKSMGQSGKICKCFSPSSGIPNSNYSRFSKRCIVVPVKPTRKKSNHANSWFFPRIEYLEKALRIGNEMFSKASESDPGLDENRDCGYQSSTSK